MIAVDNEPYLGKKQAPRAQPVFGGAADQAGKTAKQRFPCRRCGGLSCRFFQTRKLEDCPGFNAICEFCGNKGHSSGGCWKKTKRKNAASTEKAEGITGGAGAAQGTIDFDEDGPGSVASSTSHF